MKYRSTLECVNDLRRNGHLIEIADPVDANLEAAEIHRRIFQNGGPAILFSNVTGCRFPMVSNLFGTIERAKFIFRDTIDDVRRAIELKIDPGQAASKPLRYWKAPLTATRMRPKRRRSAAVLANETSIDQLPQLKSWPDDGGAFVTLPQVYTEDIKQPGPGQSNLGMYRVQLSGGKYQPNRQVGLHYQIHRGIGIHHQAAIELGQPLRVNIFVGGNPAMTLSAVMPLPDGISELKFAGALAGHRIPMVGYNGSHIYADADFCVSGTIDPELLLPEGPFGDHLGYYSLAHDFPVLNVDKVFHRDNAIWPFTVVGRPPQEDTIFGELIHELTGPIIPTVIPGVQAVHAVDATGVHPLLLAIGSERYMPYREKQQPQELLVQANAILGQGQLSLAKYLFILDEKCDDRLDIQDIEGFIAALLQRVDWRRDLHFQTRTTIDTLDYSGSGFNQGSKLVIAAIGDPIRRLSTTVERLPLPDGYHNPRFCMPGVLAVEGPEFGSDTHSDNQLEKLWSDIQTPESFDGWPLIVVVDDSEFVSRNLENFLWVVFTRSNPATDVHGIRGIVEDKHWGCIGSMVIDARTKPHHAPPLIVDPKTLAKVDSMAAGNSPIAQYL